MRPLLQRLVNPLQSSSFIPRRGTSDNAIVLKEIIHSMSKSKKKKGDVVFKLDLEKGSLLVSFPREGCDKGIACLHICLCFAWKDCDIWLRKSWMRVCVGAVRSISTTMDGGYLISSLSMTCFFLQKLIPPRFGYRWYSSYILWEVWP